MWVLAVTTCAWTNPAVTLEWDKMCNLLIIVLLAYTILAREATGCTSDSLGHMVRVDEVAIVHDGDFFLVHFLRLPW